METVLENIPAGVIYLNAESAIQRTNAALLRMFNIAEKSIESLETLLGPDAVLPLDRRANIRDALRGHWSEPVELFPLLMVLLLFVLALDVPPAVVPV